MKLYTMEQAVNPRRVRLFLAEKGLEIETVQLDIVGGENRAPDFLAINPRGILPTLVLDDGTAICESMAICRYIEALHPQPPLFGTQPKEQALIEMRQREMESDGVMPIAWAFRNTAPHFKERAQPGSAPDIPQSAELAARGKLLVPHFFERLNTLLGSADYVAGDSYSVADITAYCAYGFAKWIKMGPAPEHVNTHAWLEKIKARPALQAI